MSAKSDPLASSSRRVALEALRDLLASTLRGAEERNVAPLARVHVEVLERLDALPTSRKSSVDELKERRAKRRGETPVSERAEGGTARRRRGGS